MGTVETPHGHAGGTYSVFLAKFGTTLPAVAGAGWRVIEEEEELVAERDGTAVGVLGVEQSMLEGGEARNGGRLGFVGFDCGVLKIHKAAILQRNRRDAV